MAKTNADIKTEALRMIGAAPLNDSPATEDDDLAQAHLEAIVDEFDEVHQIGIDLTLDAFPDWIYTSLAQMLAGRLATHYEVPQYATLYWSGLRKIRQKMANETRVNGRPVRVDYF